MDVLFYIIGGLFVLFTLFCLWGLLLHEADKIDAVRNLAKRGDK